MFRFNLLSKFSGLAALFSIAYYAVSIYMEFTVFTNLMLFDALVFGLISFCAYKTRNTSPYILSHVFIGFFVFETFVVSAFSGGPNSQVLPWFCVTPMLALLLLGKRETFIWASITFTAVLILIPVNEFLSQSGLYDIPLLSPIFNVSLDLGLIAMIVLLTWLFSESNKLLQLQLSEKVDDLKTTEEELRQNMEELSATQDFLAESNVLLKDSIELLNEKNSELEMNRNATKAKKEKLEKYGATLNRLIKHQQPAQPNSHEKSMEFLLREAAAVLDIDRVGIWYYVNNHHSVRCWLQYDKVIEGFNSGMEIYEEDYPGYMQKIREEEQIVAEDAVNHPYTAEFANSYFLPNGIVSMLDVPLFAEAKALGVICFEHRGIIRKWDEADRVFAASIADLAIIQCQASEKQLAIAYIQSQKEEIERQHAQLHDLNNQLTTINQSLEERVKQRTSELEEASRRFAEYTFINVHLLRAPMCQIKGLAGLLRYTELSIDQEELLKRLDDSSKELELLLHKTTRILEAGNVLNRSLL